MSTRMLRHYDEIGLVRPTGRSAAGYREYAEADLWRLLHVEMLRSLGLSLAETAQALDEPRFAPAALLDGLLERTRERIARERDLLARLERVRTSGAADWDEVLRMVALLRGLGSKDPARRQVAALTAEADQVDLLADAVLSEGNPNVAGALRWALERHGGDDSLEPLTTALDAADRQTRLRAAAAIAELSTPAARDALRGAVRHPDEAVRDRAVLRLAQLGEQAVRPMLLELVIAGRHDVEAAEGLAALADDDARITATVRLLADELGRAEHDPAARSRLAQALGELPAAATATALEELREDGDPQVARIASYLLSRTGAD